MQKGQTGVYTHPDGTVEDAVVTRVRGGNQVDILASGCVPMQMATVGVGPGRFAPHGHDPEHAPPPQALARLVPRYVPVWHVFAVCLPSSVAAAALTTLLYHLLGGK